MPPLELKLLLLPWGAEVRLALAPALLLAVPAELELWLLLLLLPPRLELWEEPELELLLPPELNV